MVVIGEIILSALLQVLREVVSQVLKTPFMNAGAKMEFAQLETNLGFIYAVIEIAEERQGDDKYLAQWLEDLRDATYDLADILDEIRTRDHLSKSSPEKPTMWLARAVAPCLLSSSDESEMASKIKEINKRFDNIWKKWDRFRSISGGSTNPGNPSRRPLPTTSLVIDANVYGRNGDKESIRSMLLGKETFNISVISIFGMGGVGKTTIAQAVYNDWMVQLEFAVTVWVCVSPEFDVIRITKTIFEKLADQESSSNDLDTLQQGIKERLANRKFLIVLDDVWRFDLEKWNAVCLPLMSGLSGSRILVTTRDEDVAARVSSGRRPYRVNVLSKGECLKILTLHSSVSLDENPELGDVIHGLADKCKGLPLAAVVLGGVLRSRARTEWPSVLHSKIWDLQMDKNDMLPRALLLSYYDLPSQLKPLFAYCSLFPEDYAFDKNELVRLWMAEGFLGETHSSNETPEDLGCQLIDELLARSLFQKMSKDDSKFVMHDLTHALARHVACRKIYCCLDTVLNTSLEYNVPIETRHCSFLRQEYEVFGKFKSFNEAQGLRTFLPISRETWFVSYLSSKILFELVPNMCKMRVLSLSGYSSVTELPSSIGNLIHLRYLDLSGTCVVTLPDSLGGLLYLQTLSVRECGRLRKLPASLGNLSNLRHLDNSNTDSLEGMPVGIGKLIDLQTLPKVVLGSDGCIGLKQVRELKHLRGEVRIHDLHNVTKREDVREPVLQSNDNLDVLSLVWGPGSSTGGGVSEKDVIEQLQPHAGLRSLTLKFYRGLEFPSWIGHHSYSRLSKVEIEGCLNCTALPPLGRLPNLEYLDIRHMPNVRSIGHELYGTSTSSPFPKLKELILHGFPAWKKWIGVGDADHISIHCPNLQVLDIRDCRQLVHVSEMVFPALQSLTIRSCKSILLERLANPNSITCLWIENIDGVSHFSRDLIHSLESLQALHCEECKGMRSLWSEEITPQHLTHLKSLEIVSCSKLISIGHGEGQLPCNLETLRIRKCGSLKSLPNDLSKHGSLRSLDISACDDLDCKSLVTWTMSCQPNNPKDLHIRDCDQLEILLELPENSYAFLELERLTLGAFTNFPNLEDRLQKFRNLVHLNLNRLTIREFPRLDLPSLASLSIDGCVRLNSFPNCDLPPNLSRLEIFNSRTLKPLEQWGLRKLCSLRFLMLWDVFVDVEVLGDDDSLLFPPTLEGVSIIGFQNLTSLAKVLENVKSLRRLQITNCPNISILPSQGLLGNLWRLGIKNCACLKKKCAKERGEYWKMMEAIPKLSIYP